MVLGPLIFVSYLGLIYAGMRELQLQLRVLLSYDVEKLLLLTVRLLLLCVVCLVRWLLCVSPGWETLPAWLYSGVAPPGAGGYSLALAQCR